MKLGWEKRELSFLFIHYYFYLVNTGMGKKLNKNINAHPPESPLNGGIYSTIPLRGGVPFYGWKGAFHLLRFLKP